MKKETILVWYLGRMSDTGSSICEEMYTYIVMSMLLRLLLHPGCSFSSASKRVALALALACPDLGFVQERGNGVSNVFS